LPKGLTMKIAALAFALWMAMILISTLGPLWFGTGGPSARVGYGPTARISHDADRDLDDERDQGWARRVDSFRQSTDTTPPRI